MEPEKPKFRRLNVGDGLYIAVPAPASAGDARVPVDLARGRPPLPRSVRLAVGATAAALSVAALARWGAGAQGVLAAGLLPVLAVLAAVDLRARVLPNRILGPALLVVLVFQLVWFPDRVVECLIAAVGAGAFLLAPCLVQPGAMGMGDVKLGALLGLALGREVVGALVIGCLAVLPVAFAVLVLRRGDARRATLPFGPFLALGAAVALLA